MRSKIPCEIIQDLLPGYIDALTSEKTNEEIKLHLDECEACHEKYIIMSQKENRVQSEDIDYLKTVNRKSNKKVLVFSVIALCAGLFVGFFQTFIAGIETGQYEVLNVKFIPKGEKGENTIYDVSVDVLLDGGLAISKYRLEDNELHIYTVPNLLKESSYQTLLIRNITENQVIYIDKVAYDINRKDPFIEQFSKEIEDLISYEGKDSLNYYLEMIKATGSVRDITRENDILRIDSDDTLRFIELRAYLMLMLDEKLASVEYYDLGKPVFTYTRDMYNALTIDEKMTVREKINHVVSIFLD